VPSPDFFGKRDWEGKARRCFRSLKEIRDGIAYANGLPKLVAAFNALRDFQKRVEDIHNEHVMALANLHSDWWDAACHWANTAHQPERKYRLEGRIVLFDDGFDEEQSWPIPTPAEIGGSMWPEIQAMWPS